MGGQQSRPSAARPAPSPPASPPFRRPLAWSRRLWCAWWGAVAPAPAGRLSVVGLVGLAAGRALSCVRVTGWRVAFAPFRRARGLPPGACVGGFEAFGFASAALARSCGRARGVFFPPNNPPFFPVALARRDAENFSYGGKKQLCPRPPKDGRLSCGRGPRLGCVRGHREKAVCLPASGRARSACRAVCAVRALRRASPPSSGGQARVVKGFSILQREHRGTGTRLPALRSPPDGGDLAETTQKSPRSDQKRGDREIPNSQTASRTAENGLSKVVAPPIGAVWVALAARSDVVHVVPPAIRANVVDLARAPHPAHVKFAIRWALVGQDH